MYQHPVPHKHKECRQWPIAHTRVPPLGFPRQFAKDDHLARLSN